MKTKKNAGIWIDSKQAIIVSIINNTESVDHVYSGIEGQTRIEGESKEYTRMGDQYMSGERKKEAGRLQQLKDFYKNIVHKIKDSESIYIMGPAEVKIELQKFISASNIINPNTIIVDAADHLTENQIVAIVKTQFKN